MAATGEATGMAAKTTLRELRLRAEAAHRRFEPGYRATPQAAPQPPKQLTAGDPALQIPFQPQAPLTPERVQVDPRTGQPRRRQARGFGRGDGASHQLIGTHYVDPAAPRGDGRSTEFYRTHPEAAAKKVAHQAAINARPEERQRRAELNRERRKRGIAGKGGPDVSHTTSGRTTLEDPSTNRARNGHGGTQYRVTSMVLHLWSTAFLKLLADQLS